jgi:hypothetical protein
VDESYMYHAGLKERMCVQPKSGSETSLQTFVPEVTLTMATGHEVV